MVSGDRVGETFDSVSRLAMMRPLDTGLTRWRRATARLKSKAKRKEVSASPGASTPASRMSLTGARIVDSQDRLVNQIIGSQEALTAASPAPSVTEVSSMVRRLFSSLHKSTDVKNVEKGIKNVRT